MPRPYFHSNKDIISQMLRVDHSGEYGAVRIYKGQIDAKACSPHLLKHMYDQEIEHLAFFESHMKKENVRPSIMIPIWHVGGYLLGFVSGMFGKKSAMLCTEAVEEVIDKHYLQQINYLSSKTDEKSKYLAEKIDLFRQDEIEHKNIAIESGSGEVCGYPILSFFIKSICSCAIAISKRV